MPSFRIPAPANASDAEVKQFMAAQDAPSTMISVDAGLFDFFGNALGWSLVMDTIIGKMGWSDVKEEETFTMVMPWQFGVFAEEVTDLESQPAFVHTYYIDYDNACQRLIRAGLANKIDQLNVVNTPFEGRHFPKWCLG